MNALTQWLLVLAIVAVCAAYAVRALMPAGARRALARRLRAAGRDEWARGLEAGGGCDACAGAAARKAGEGGAGKPGCG
jgi:hypothetical protein